MLNKDDDVDEEASDIESDDEDEKAEREFKQRLKEAGGLWRYLKTYSIFLPQLWPTKNRKLQFCLFLLGLCIAAERVLNVLSPRQEGIVIDKLIESYGTGQLPWRELTWLFGLRFLNSQGTRGMIQELLELRIDNWSTKQMTNLIFGHIMGLSMHFHSNADSAELMKATEQASSLTKLVRLLLFEFLPIILDLVVAVVYVTNLFDIYFAIIMVVMACGVGLLSWRGSVWEARKRRGYSQKERNVTKVQYQSISHWATVSYFNRGEHQHNRLMSAVSEMITSLTSLKITELSAQSARVYMLFLGRTSANFLAAYRISQGLKPVGNFVILNSIWDLFTEPLFMLSYISEDITSYLVDSERALHILQEKPSVTDAPNARELNVSHGEVQFKNVSFSYDGQRQVVKDISFVAQPGQTVAFVGETGAGKSTLLKLLFRFYDVTGGAITIDGVDIRNVTLSSLREALGIVPQETAIFNTSVLENVRYARLDASDEEVVQACMGAHIHNKIMSFTDQYHTLVGERGVKLSGGERQRISIARIILKQPKILFLDEATSAIDSKTEMGIQSSLAQLAEGRTAFVIAHRLSTIIDADVIVFMENGRVAEFGSHDDLIRRGGRYQELWEIQTTHNQSKKNS